MLNVLYVEDDAASRNVLRMIQRISPELMTALILEDSEDFERQLLALAPQPNLILLDIHVKPFSGFEMLEIIRRHKAFDLVPVVALTASVMNEEVELLKQAGFQGVLGKPLNMDEFPELVERIMSGEKVWYVW